MSSNRERQRLWRARHPEKSRENVRRYHAQNAEAIRARKKIYYQAVRKPRDQTPEGRHKDINRKARRRSVIKSGVVTKAEWDSIKADYSHRCAYCGKRRKLEQDHVVALSRGGAHAASNIKPACKPCNSRKGN